MYFSIHVLNEIWSCQVIGLSIYNASGLIRWRQGGRAIASQANDNQILSDPDLHNRGGRRGVDARDNATYYNNNNISARRTGVKRVGFETILPPTQ